MREILFRGKDVYTKEWVYGGYCNHDKVRIYFTTYGPQTRHIIIKDGFCYFGHEPQLCGYEVDPETVGQYTGLLDKNIERIFDGDILKLDGEDGFFVLEFQDDTARFVMSGDSMVVDFDNFRSYEVEVIGNIHDNPELLKEGGEE